MGKVSLYCFWLLHCYDSITLSDVKPEKRLRKYISSDRMISAGGDSSGVSDFEQRPKRTASQGAHYSFTKHGYARQKLEDHETEDH